MGMSLTATGFGGGGCKELGEVLIVVSPGNATFQVGEVGGDPPHRKYPWGFPPPGGENDHGAPPLETRQWEFSTPANGGREEKGRS